MSKEKIIELNKKLVEHLEKTGVKNACYYEPISDDFWNQKYRVVFCNIEPYDTNESWPGIHKITEDVYDEGWNKNKTIRFSMKFNYFINKLFEGKTVTEEDVCKTIDIEDLMENFKNYALYMNIRSTTSETIRQNRSKVYELYRDSFYEEYLRDYIKALKDDNETELYIVLGGQDTCNIINRIFPELKLKYDGYQVWISDNKVMFLSIQHPRAANFSNKYLFEKLQQIQCDLQ